METSGKIRCVVVTPEKTILERGGFLGLVPAFDGEIAIMPGHASSVARLGPGELRLTTESEKIQLFIDGGFAQIQNDVVTVLTPRVRELKDLDSGTLEKDLAELSAESSSSAQGQKSRTDRMNLVRASLRIARRESTRLH